MFRERKINWYNIQAAQVGVNMAAIADTHDDPRYRDMVWNIRTTLEQCENERRVKAWLDKRRSTKIRCGFKGKNQLPLFMVWKEYIENGEVVFAKVSFNSRDRFGI